MHLPPYILLNSSLILISSFYQHHIKHTHPNKSLWFLREHNELSGARGIGFHICTSVHKHSPRLVHVCAGAWNNKLQVFISCLTQYLCLSLCIVSSEAARGRVCVWVTATIHWTARASDRIFNAAEVSVEVALECFKMLFKCQLSPASMTLCSPTRFPSRLRAPFTATWQL